MYCDTGWESSGRENGGVEGSYGLDQAISKRGTLCSKNIDTHKIEARWFHASREREHAYMSDLALGICACALHAGNH